MALPYYKAYPRDFIEGTIGMPLELKGAYRLVIDLIYMQGGKLPDDARYISGLLGCTVRKWKALRSELIQRDKLQVNGEFLTNYRAANELETLGKLQEKQRENGSKPKKNNGLPKAMAEQTRDYPEPEPDIEKEETIVSSKKHELPLTLVDGMNAAQPNPPPKPKPKRKPKTLLSEDWQPDDKDLQHARAHRSNFTEDEIEEMANGFRDHHIANQKPSADWNASWRTWCGNARKYGISRKVGGYSSQQNRPENAIVAEVARRRAAG